MEKLSRNLIENVQYIRDKWSGVGEFVERRITVGSEEKKLSVYMFFILGAANTEDIAHYIINPLLKTGDTLQDFETVEEFLKQKTSIAQVTFGEEFEKIQLALGNGETIVLIEGSKHYFSLNTTQFAVRPVGELQRNKSFLGGQIGFSEDFQLNMSLLRKVLRTPTYKTKVYTVGEDTRTQVAVCYVEGVVNKDVLDEVNKKIGSLKIRKVLGETQLMEGLCGKESPWIPLYMFRNRPDSVAASLLDGHVALIIDGTPNVAVVPISLTQVLHTADDAYVKGSFYYANILRFISVFLSLFLPGIYIATVIFHREIIPLGLYMSLIGQFQYKPFPLFIEIALLIFLLEVLIDTAFKLPNALTFILSLLGTFFIGDTMVQAGLVSTITIVVIGITIVSGLAVPDTDFSYTIIIGRMFYLFAGSILGYYGLVLMAIFHLIHINHLRSFGVPIMSPMAPFTLKDQRDSLARFSVLSTFSGKHSYENEETEGEGSQK